MDIITKRNKNIKIENEKINEKRVIAEMLVKKINIVMKQ